MLLRIPRSSLLQLFRVWRPLRPSSTICPAFHAPCFGTAHPAGTPALPVPTTTQPGCRFTSASESLPFLGERPCCGLFWAWFVCSVPVLIFLLDQEFTQLFSEVCALKSIMSSFSRILAITISPMFWPIGSVHPPSLRSPPSSGLQV